MRVFVSVAAVVPGAGVVGADPEDVGSVLRCHILNSFYLMHLKGKQVPAGHGVVLKNNELHKPAHQIILISCCVLFWPRNRDGAHQFGCRIQHKPPAATPGELLLYTGEAGNSLPGLLAFHSLTRP